jgi:hypothetical protein
MRGRLEDMRPPHSLLYDVLLISVVRRRQRGGREQRTTTEPLDGHTRYLRFSSPPVIIFIFRLLSHFFLTALIRDEGGSIEYTALVNGAFEIKNGHIFKRTLLRGQRGNELSSLLFRICTSIVSVSTEKMLRACEGYV